MAANYRPIPFVPDQPSPPGAVLGDWLLRMEMPQADLATRIGLSTKHVNQIIHGAAPLTHETALALEMVTGVPSRIWNSLEAGYRDSLLRASATQLTEDDTTWLSSMPIHELQERGFLLRDASRGAIFHGMLAFFGVADREAWERLWLRPIATFRRSRVFQARPGATAAWLRIGELEGRARHCMPFDARSFRGVLTRARALTRRRDDFSGDLMADCAQAGVALVFEREIPGCRASGAARWLSPTKALIQLSDRYKREDSFWFSFFHEAAHLVLHSKRDSFVDDERRAGDIVEDEANRFAAELLIPPDRARELRQLQTTYDVERFAASIGVGPAVVVGRLQNDGCWDWSQGRHLIGRLEISD